MSYKPKAAVNNAITELIDGMPVYGARELRIQAGRPPVYKVGENSITPDDSLVFDYDELQADLEAIDIVDQKNYRFGTFIYISENPQRSRTLKVFVASSETELVITFRENASNLKLNPATKKYASKYPAKYTPAP